MAEVGASNIYSGVVLFTFRSGENIIFLSLLREDINMGAFI